MTYEEAVKTLAIWMQHNLVDGWGELGQLPIEAWFDEAGPALDAIGYRQMQERLEWLECEVVLRFDPAHAPKQGHHTLGQVFGDIRQMQERIEGLESSERYLTSSLKGCEQRLGEARALADRLAAAGFELKLNADFYFPQEPDMPTTMELSASQSLDGWDDALAAYEARGWK